MKNFKKVLSLTLALVMILSTMTVAFAAEVKNADKAEVLHDLDLFHGVSVTEFVPALEDGATREQAAKLIVDAMGWEVDMAATSSFADVSDWAQPYVAVIEAEGVTIGIGGNLFGGQNPITGLEFVTWALRALGYDQTASYADQATVAAEAGITAGADVAVLRDDVVGTIYEMLTVAPKDGTVTLIEALVAADPSLEAVAVAAGLIEATPDVAEIKKVTAPSLIQVIIELTAPIEDAGDDEDYEWVDDGDTTAVIDGDTDVELSDDGMTITLTLTEPAEQQDEVEMDIIGVLDEDVTVDVEFFDITIPEVTGAEVVGNDTIKVYFSEPMFANDGLTDKDNYEVEDADGDELYVSNVTAVDDNRAALVEIYADLEGDVEITIEKVEDYQGYTCVSTTIPVQVDIDDEDPVVVGHKDEDQNSITLIFDDDIEFVGTLDLEDIYHTNSSNYIEDAVIDGNELELTFAEDEEMPIGTTYIYIEKEVVNDLWDNENAKIVYVADITVDETAPQVVGDVEVEEQDIFEIEFDEDIVIDADTDFEITLLDEDGDEINTNESVNDDGDTLIVDATKDLYGNFTVILEDVEDEAGNKTGRISLDFFVEDETAPDPADFTAILYNEDDATQLIKVDFDEEMDVDSVTSKLMYFADGVSLDDDDVEIDLVDNGEAVEIEVPASLVNLVAGDDLVIGRVMDAAGNLLDGLSVTVELAAAGVVLVDSVELTDEDTIVVTMEDELVELDIDAFSFADDDEVDFVIAKVRTGLNSDNETTITFTLADEVNTDATSNGAITYMVAAGAGENEFGEEVEVVDVATEIDDKVDPELEEVQDDDNDDVDNVVVTQVDTTFYITLTFTEDIDADSVSILTFSVDDGEVGVDAVDVDGETIELTLDAEDLDDEDYDSLADLIGVSVELVGSIQDESGNIVSTLDTEVANILD
jgi:hypothetical protein